MKRPGSAPDRHDTLASPISAMLAEGTRDPAAPEADADQGEQTRRVGESDRQDMRHLSARFGGDPDVAAARHRAENATGNTTEGSSFNA